VNAFDIALAGRPCWLTDGSGGRLRLPIVWWRAEPDRADATLLDRCAGPTVDVGCGPGRLAAALTARGIVALGVDTSRLAVQLTRQRGAAALRRTVFERLPGEGRWRHVLLADGNIGIGGNPVDLLARCAELIGPAGSVLVEADPQGSGVRRCLATVEHDGGRSDPFRWALVGANAVTALAAATRLAVHARWRCDGRAFAELIRR
jgi:SAM-dependent methyltransferase